MPLVGLTILQVDAGELRLHPGKKIVSVDPCRHKLLASSDALSYFKIFFGWGGGMHCTVGMSACFVYAHGPTVPGVPCLFGP